MLSRATTTLTPEQQVRRAHLIQQARKEQLEQSAQRMLRALAKSQDSRA